MNSGNIRLPQISRNPPREYATRAFPVESGSADQTNLAIVYARTLLRHKWMVLGFALAGALAGFAMTLTQPSTYRARTSLDIQSINEDFMNIRAVDPTVRIGANSVETVLQTEIKLLQSDTLLNRVVAKLTPAPAASSGAAVPQAHRLLRVLHIKASTPPTRNAVLKDLASHVSVKPLGMTRLVEIGCESPDRLLAAEFCNTMADEFLSQDQELRWDAARQTIDWLGRQLTEVRSKLQDSEQKLQEFQTQNKLFYSQDKESVAQAKLRLLQSSTSQAEADRAAREAQYRIGTSVNPDSLPAVLDDEPSKQYRIKLAELERLRAEYSNAFTPESPQIQKIDAQISALRASIEQARSNLVDRLRNEFDAASGRERALASAYQAQEKLVSGQMAKTAQLNMLQREAESGREVYATLLQKVKEAGFASALKSNPVRVVDRATPPVIPAGPRRKVNSAAGFVVGLFGGALLAFFRTRTDNSLRLPGDAAKHLSIREFGVIPGANPSTLSNEERAGAWSRLLRLEGAGSRSAAARIFTSPLALELVTWTRKRSLMAEAYRGAMSSILYSSRRARLNSILVSSPTMGEGKTTLVSNLGIAFAEAGQRVILVDADLRRPRLHTIFDTGNSFGMQQALRGENDAATCPLSLLAHETLVPNLFVMPSGSGSEDPSLLLHSANLGVLLKRLQHEFDLVLIDSPPMLHLPDARIIARLTRGMVLVLRAGVATRETAATAAQLLNGDRTPILGLILNDFNPDKESIHGYYRDYYRYRGGVSA
jgi:succinoglycan biosynthesis transport protein ExoP